MAVVVGTVSDAYGFCTPSGPSQASTISAVENETYMCFVNVTWPAGTYAQADDANFTPATAITNAMRNGKTAVPIAASFVSSGDENGAIIGAGDCGNTAGTFLCPLTQEDLSTERGAGGMSATWNRPLVFAVTFYVPVTGN
ncbi:MAG: hypothetical protein ACYSWU_26705 [Planctomycetota bacterium]|jgi:hypothetical protein